METVGPQSSLTLPAGTVTIPPGTNVQSVIDAHPAGTSYLLKAGTYTQQVITLKQGDTFSGEVGAILTGGDVTPVAFPGHAANVTIQNLVIEHYASPDGMGAVNLDGPGIVVKHNEIRFNRYAGVNQNGGAIASWNSLHDNGAFGVMGAGGNILFEHNECAFNNRDHAYDPYNGAGCSKWVLTENLIVRNNYTHDNGGPGFWTDISNNGTLYEGNTVERNWRAGIFHEISYSAIIRNNIIRNNGLDKQYAGWNEGAGISVVTSSDVEVYGNTLTDNAQGIIGLEDARGNVDPASQTHGEWLLKNLRVHDNTINSVTDLGAGFGNAGGVLNSGAKNPFTAGNVWTHNTYTLGSHAGYFYWANFTIGSVAEWKAIGQDTTGSFQSPTPAPQPSPSPSPAPTPSPSPVPVPSPVPSPVTAGALYISPLGNDSNAGTQAAPFKTFTKALASLKLGGELVVADGTYTKAANGCVVDPPSGTASARTIIHTLNGGAAMVVGCGLSISNNSGTKTVYVTIDGLSFDAQATDEAAIIYNTDHVTIKNGGFHSSMNHDGNVFDVGNSDGRTNTNDLFEDLWIWGKARGIAANYTADSNTWRRIVIRGDGCSSTDCDSSGNPNIGITTYNSQHVTMENVIILDRVLLGSGNNYADFATAQHNSGTSVANGDNQWLGLISLNAPDHCFYFESDNTGPQPEVTIANAFCWKSKEDMSIQPKGGVVLNGVTTTWPAVYTEGASVTKANIAVNATQASHAGGASALFRYVDRKLTTDALWPWPNEARIKSEMCATAPRGFCSAPSLTNYVWSQMGSGSPY